MSQLINWSIGWIVRNAGSYCWISSSWWQTLTQVNETGARVNTSTKLDLSTKFL